MRSSRAVVLVGMVLAALLTMALPAGATVSGPCDGSAEWPNESPELEVVASELEPGEVVIIPLAGDVIWTGLIMIEPEPTSPRPVSGDVKVRLPSPLGSVQVGNWSSSGTLTGNSGSYEYDFPSILAGFEVTVEGQHWEGTLEPSGPPTCSGDVTLALAGTNPVGFIAGGLSVVSLMGAYLAVRVKGPAAGGSK